MQGMILSQMCDCINIVHILFSGCSIERAKIIASLLPRQAPYQWNAVLKIIMGFSFYPFVPDGAACQTVLTHCSMSAKCQRVRRWNVHEIWWLMLSFISCLLCYLACLETACPWHSTTFCGVRLCTGSLGRKHTALVYTGSAGEIRNTMLPCSLRSCIPCALVASVVKSVLPEKGRKIILETSVKVDHAGECERSWKAYQDCQKDCLNLDAYLFKCLEELQKFLLYSLDPSQFSHCTPSSDIEIW